MRIFSFLRRWRVGASGITVRPDGTAALGAALCFLLAVGAGPGAEGGAGQARAQSQSDFVRLVSTTSTQNSGLLDAILPRFTARSGIEVRLIAVGTGQALRIARSGDADLILVHDRTSEEAFVAEGLGLARVPVMYNDFVLIGPPGDPAGIAGMDDVARALARIQAARAVFVSRGDDSGTHRRELGLWQAAGIDPSGPDWYRETGAGMGATLNIGIAMEGYVLTDRGTWLAFGNPGRHVVLVEGDRRLANPYGVTVLNPDRYPNTNATAAQALADWLTGPEGQAAIGGYTVKGVLAFCPVTPAAARSGGGDAAASGGAQHQDQAQPACPADRSGAGRDPGPIGQRP